MQKASESNVKDLEDDCGFCAYMRKGPCGSEFTKWERCVEIHQERGNDFARKCVQVTRALTACMANNREYYDIPGISPDESTSNEHTQAGT
mmetsp:Transcript_13993/g.18677  ORF Transcript_13993/g.18677 Transcript_13993/m.18677 type:complete len:91 (-) Transcript_13993:36-308(-)